MGVTSPDVVAPAAETSAAEGAPWSGPLCVEGVFTGDGRKFDPGSLYWENLPLPLRWAPEDFGSHDGAKHVGWIDSVTRQGQNIMGTGTAFDAEFVGYMGQCGQIGVSIDPDMAEFDIVVPPDAQPAGSEPAPGEPTPVLEEQQIFHKARIRAATCVDIPAFIDAVIKLDTPQETPGTAPSDGILSIRSGGSPSEGAGSISSADTPTDGTEIPKEQPAETYKAAGIVMQAADTGRLLMIQRAHNVHTGEQDPNAGLWEFPGGTLEEGEDPHAAAQREFAEETGMMLPAEAEHTGQWASPDGVYQAFVHVLPNEKMFDISGDQVPNPDDPDGDITEALAWWDPLHIQGDCIRPEVALMPLEDMVTTPVQPKAPVAPPKDPSTPDAPPVADEQQVADIVDKALETIRGYIAYPSTATPDTLQALHDELAKASDLLNPQPDGKPTEQDAIIASAAPVAPPDEWFTPFDLDGPTPLTVTADGRVFGHLATWDSCHRSGQYAGKCMAPPSDPKAPFFHMGQVLTASGAAVDVGLVTVGGGHAPRNRGLMAALEHYDDVSTAAATVVAREDEYGIGLFGSVTPDATPAQVAALRRSPLSGDWRKEKGKWRLIAAHAVNTGGFPIPRGLVASVSPAAFLTFGRPDPKQPDPDSVNLRAVAQRLARSAGLDTESLVASARAAMADLDCGCDEEMLVASVSGDVNLPIASYDIQWDGGAAAARVFDHFTTGEGDSATVDTASVGKAFLWRIPDQPADQKSGYSLPFADIIDGELQVVPSGVQAAAGGHGVSQLKGASPDELAEIKSRIGTLYEKIKSKYPEAPTSPYDNPEGN